MIKEHIKHFEFTEEDIADGKYDGWELIEPFRYSVNIYDGLEEYNNDMADMTIAQRRLFAIHIYNSQVNNGGHHQFFFNSSGIVWKDALDGLRMIGDDADADNFQKAIDKFGGNVPFDRAERNEALDRIGDIDVFDEIDRAYYERNSLFNSREGEGVERYLMEYIKSHPAEFVVNGDFPYFDGFQFVEFRF